MPGEGWFDHGREDDGDFAAVRGQFAQLVKQEEHGAVAHVGQARAVAAGVAQFMFPLNLFADMGNAD